MFIIYRRFTVKIMSTSILRSYLNTGNNDLMIWVTIGNISCSLYGHREKPVKTLFRHCLPVQYTGGLDE